MGEGTLEYASVETLRDAGGALLLRVRDGGDRPVLLKVLGPQPHSRESDWLENERRVAGPLDPAVVLRPLRRTTHRGLEALVLEDFDGVPLDRLLEEQGPLAPGRFLPLAAAAARALAAVHQQGVIHKDLQPANLLVNETTGKVKLTGFSIAAVVPRQPPPSRLEGTLAYLSPEQSGRMNRVIDHRTDLYALGATFYQLLTGETPFPAEDPLEAVHGHIARVPVPPEERVAGLPAPVSQIVLTLLAKEADDRYQTALGLARDLERCARDWKATGRIEPFPLRREDRPTRLRIPRRLYGQERALEQLRAAFAQVAAGGAPAVVLVTGEGGAGKSSLARELHDTVVRARGLFLTGKFEEYPPGLPYAALGRAFEGPLGDLLAEPDQEMARRRERLLRALEDNGRLMVDLFPQLRLIIGEPPPMIELPPAEARRRFGRAFQRFVAALTEERGPLVLFLDDLQWADADSLALIEELVTGAPLPRLLLVGAYRDGEHEARPALLRTLKALEAGASAVRLALGPLGPADVAALLADALYAGADEVEPLARLVRAKTAGNPFFIIQLLGALQEERLIEIGPPPRFDLAAIAAKAHTSNVIEFMASRVGAMPARTLEVLELAAAAGPELDLPLLAALCRRSDEQLQGDLVAAVREGLVERAGEGYRFAHDRVRQSAYSLIPEEARPATHLRIGRLLLQRTPGERMGEAAFAIANQLDRAASLVTDEGERVQAAQLNLTAGRGARARNAHATALEYLRAGMDLLGPGAWSSHYLLAYQLSLARAECELRAGHPEETLRLTRLIAAQARTDLERSAAVRLEPDAYVMLGRFPDAVASMVAALALLGVTLPAHPTAADVRAERERVERLRAGRSVESLAALPPVSDSRVAAVLSVQVVSIMGDPHLHGLFVARMVALSLEHGVSPESAIWYVNYAALLVAMFGEHAEAAEFAALAMKLSRGTPAFSGVVSLVPMVLFWTEPMSEWMALTREALAASTAAGDEIRANYVSSAIVSRLLMWGEPLDRVHAQAETYLASARVPDIRDILTVHRQSVRALEGRTRALGRLDDDGFDQTRFEAGLTGRSSMLTGWYWASRLRSCLIAGDLAAARAAGEEVKRRLPAIAGNTATRDHCLYLAVVCAASFASGTPQQQAEWLVLLREHLAQLERWTRNNPSTFGHSRALVAAELAVLEGRPEDAARLFDETVRLARAARFLADEALAYERAAAFYAGRGAAAVAEALLVEAHACYLRWGADGKVRALEHAHPHLATVPRASGGPLSARAEDLDLLSVVKTSQALSGEVLHERLVGTLMEVMLAQGGATRGALLLVRDGAPAVEAEAALGPEGAVVRRGPEASEVPGALVQFVWRTRERVVLDDARTDDRFGRDEYLARAQPRSVLCMPIRRQAEVVALLYLENAALAGAFTPPRLAVLELLAAQAAISLQNARFVAQELAARSAAEEEQARTALLAETSALLSESLDWRVVLERLATLVVKHLADWCLVDLVEEGTIRRVAGAHRDPGKAALLRELRDRYPPAWDSPQPTAEVLRTGQPFFLEETAPATVQRLTRDDHHARLVEALGAGSAMVVPLVARGNVIGALSLVRPSRPYRPADLALAQELARRAATAVDNARLYRQAQEAVRLREEFLVVASHELNTPMAALMLTLEGLATDVPGLGPRSELWQQMVTLAGRQGRRLTRLIDTLLDTARISRGAFTLELEETDLGRVVREAVGRQTIELRRAGCDLKLEADDHVVGRWDPLRLEQLILNLLGNAMKFGAGKPIEVKAARDDGHARLSVTDHGIGIAPDRQARIFERLERGVSITNFGGLGLGLYITRHIVSAHGGEISVQSEPGRGATFVVRLPLAAAG